MLICFFGNVLVYAQRAPLKERHTIIGKKSDFVAKQVFKDELSQYDLFDMSTQEIYNAINQKKREQREIAFSIGEHQWDVVLQPSNILSENFVSRILSVNGIQTLENIRDYTFEGYVENENTIVRLTSTPNYFMAYFKTPDAEYYIEPTQRFTNTLSDKSFVLYNKADVLPTAGTCITLEADEWDKSGQVAYEKTDGCLEIEYALAADYSMFTKYGGPENILLHVSTVLNMVNVDYQSAFAKELRFIISEQVTSTCPTCNQWSETTNAQDLLKNFDDWGPIGFLNPHDLGSLWTDRNFDGTTVAVAWIGKVCTSKRYNCVQDFTSSYATLRQVNSHELGHNFDAHHDPNFTQFIMTPAVNSSFNVWSPETIAEINAHIYSRDCLAECAQEVVEVEEPVEEKLILNAKLWLMGFYDANLGAMKTELVALNLLPTQQPFHGEPWNYQGNENISELSTDFMDWVLVELRNDENADEIIAQKAVLINSAGHLINPDGSANIEFDIPDGNYYVAIHHKSHLRTRTSLAHAFAAGTATSLDFTQPGDSAISHHLVEKIPGVPMIYCGDYDQNGIINFLDLTTWIGFFEAGGIYDSVDGNADGLVNLGDITYWLDYQNVFSF